jgi:hypothetical protein
MLFCSIQFVVPKAFQDDLPSVSVSRQRALGLITAEMTEFVVRFGDVAQFVGVKSWRFPNGGGWSLFIAPCCGRSARVLKLFDGRVLCRRCLRDCGVGYRGWPMSVRRRAEMRIPKLCAMLESEESLRLKPSTLWGVMEKRSRHEASLRRNVLIATVRNGRHKKLLRQTEDVEVGVIAAPKMRAKPSKPSSG